MSDPTKHILICTFTSAISSCVIALLIWLSLIATSCKELMEHLFAPVWFSGVALAMGVGKEYEGECAEYNDWSWDDVAIDVVGAIIGASLICGIIKLILI